MTTFTPALKRPLGWALALALAFAPWPSRAADSDAAQGLKLERVVMLMRHGIRPPTKATVTPPGIAAEPWPSWDAPYGHLTAHGAQAIRLLGQFDRESLAARGLLPRTGCPRAVAVWSDTDQRTIATGRAARRNLPRLWASQRPSGAGRQGPSVQPI